MIKTISRVALTAAFYVIFALTMPAKGSTVTVVGNSTGSSATATVNLTFNPASNTLTFTITNTSPFDARVTGVGFDVVNGDFSGNRSTGLNGFIGANSASFIFSNGALGNVPQFKNAVLDFGWTTGNSGNFNGGSPNNGLAPGQSLSFSVSGSPFAGMTEAQIANSIFLRFQRVGADGNGSDVGTPNGTVPVPEPATMFLLGTGLTGIVVLIRRRRKSA